MWAATQCEINQALIVQIVALAVIGIYRELVAGPFESLTTAIALQAPTKMPCRWHCEQQRQDGGIPRCAAGNVL
jgi:hypothetical protein